MNKLFLVVSIFIVVSTGCSGSSKNQSPSNDSNNSQAASSATMPKAKTVDSITLEPKALLDGKLALLLPQGFKQMNQEMLATKYPAANRPTTVYSNPNGTISIAINHTKSPLNQDNLDAFHRTLDPTIRQQVPNAKWMFSGFQIHNGRRWVQLEFQSPAVDTTIHNMMVATSLENRTLIVSFNVTEELSKEWLGAGREIIGSLHIAE